MKKLYFFSLAIAFVISAQLHSQTHSRGSDPVDTVGAPYCHPTYSGTNTNGNYISNIAITGSFDEPIDPLDYTYQNLPLTTGSLYRSQQLQLIVTAGTVADQTIAVWIDMDHNNTFDAYEKDELFGLGNGDAATFDFSIPQNAPLGLTRIRIMLVNTSTNLEPCGTYVDGETLDFTIYVNESPEPYCAPVSLFGNSAGDYLAGIKFGTVNYTAGADTLGAAYVNLTAFGATAMPGGSAMLSIKNNPSYDETVGIWIDWQNDNLFDAVDTLTLSPGQKDSVAIHVPANQPVGSYRLRARVIFDESLTACGARDYSCAYDMMINIIPVSVNEDFAANYSLYPNPVSSTLFITTAKELGTNASLAVYDVTGRMVASQKIQGAANSRIEIPVSALTTGIYLVQINANGKTASQRFVVE